MAQLLKKPVQHPLNDAVQIIQDFKPEDVNLKYTGIKILDIQTSGIYEETTQGFEICIVALTGKIDVSDGESIYKDLGTRDSVFEKMPTDSIYISKDHHIQISAVKDARVIICYAPCDEGRPTELIQRVAMVLKIEVNMRINVMSTISYQIRTQPVKNCWLSKFIRIKVTGQVIHHINTTRTTCRMNHFLRKFIIMK